MRKYIFILLAAAALCIQGCSSDSNKPIKCHVSGTVTEAAGDALIIPFGQGSSDAIATLRVVDGKFDGSFKGIENLAYQLVIWDKDNNQGIFTYFFPDKGGVQFTCDGSASNPIEYSANGSVNKSFLKEKEQENAAFASRWASLDEKGAEMETTKTFLSEKTYQIMEELQSKDIKLDRRNALLEQIGSMEKDSTLYSDNAKVWLKEQDTLLKEQQEFRKNWIISNPDVASLFLLYTEINSQKQDGQDTSELENAYRTVFADKFPHHIYHSAISRLID